MRVISGCVGGRTLLAPKGDMTRPTSDKTKEAMFNILAAYGVVGCRFLDLFSGSGAIGIEALSRGADYAVLVESRYDAVEVIKKNLERVGLGHAAKIIKRDVCEAIKGFGLGVEFDIIFMDPPYKIQDSIVPEVLRLIRDKGLLHENGIIVVEHGSRVDLDFLDYFETIKQRSFGKEAVLTLLRHQNEDRESGDRL